MVVIVKCAVKRVVTVGGIHIVVHIAVVVDGSVSSHIDAVIEIAIACWVRV